MSARFACLALAAIFASGCASAPPPPPPPPAVPPAPARPAPTSLLGGALPSFSGLVARIEHRGASISNDGLLRVLASHVGEPFEQAQVQEDIRRLWAVGLFDDVSVEVGGHPSGVILTYVLVERPPIERVTLAGAKQIPEAELAPLVSELRDRRADPAMLARAARTLEEHYSEAGYRQAKVEIDTTRSGQGPVEVRLMIDEGPRVTIDRWTFTGNAKLREADLRAQMKSGAHNTAGGVYREDLWERDALLLTAYYFDHGMLQVRVGPAEIAPSADGHALSVTVPIEEGPIFRVRKISVADAAAKKGARRPTGVLQVKAGDVFNRARIKEDIDRLRAWFDRTLHRKVEITPATDLDVAGASADLVLRVEDAPP